MHFYHLAAIYDMEADEETIRIANIEGTINAVDLANEIEAGCFEPRQLDRRRRTLQGHLARGPVRRGREPRQAPLLPDQARVGAGRRANSTTVPWRVYRPGIVVGDSETGEMDKIDGPYYFFKLIQRLRDVLPPWAPTVGVEGKQINVVPVDFVADAMDHISHSRRAGQPGLPPDRSEPAHAPAS